MPAKNSRCSRQSVVAGIGDPGEGKPLRRLNPTAISDRGHNKTAESTVQPQQRSAFWGARSQRARVRALPDSLIATRLNGGFGGQHVIDRVGEIVDARYGDNDDVAMTLTILGNPEEFAAPVFAQIDRKKFSFDLQFSCFDDAIHGRRREC
jgi:hypothetical protein